MANAIERNQRRVKTGVVVSDKMDKTIVVRVQTIDRHPVYKKIIRSSNKLKAHDESNECKIGDKVEIMETKPKSKDKYFRLVKVIEKAK